jgi:hypothetical protein
MAPGHCADYRRSKLSRGARRNGTPRVPRMTGYKMRRIQVRLEKLGKLFPEKPVVTPEQDIRRATVQQMSCEDLMTLRRMIKAGRLQASNERESQAVAAYRSAVERVIRLTGGSSKRGINRLIDG